MDSLRVLAILMVMGMLITQYTNCANYSENSLLQGTSALTSLNGVNQSEAYLEPPGISIDVKSTETVLHFAGNCSPGNSTSHYIEFEILALDSGNQMIVNPDSICQSGNVMSMECFRYITPECEHGRYYAAIPIGQAFRDSTVNQNFYLQGQLVSVDEKGTETRNERAGFEGFSIVIRK